MNDTAQAQGRWPRWVKINLGHWIVALQAEYKHAALSSPPRLTNIIAVETELDADRALEAITSAEARLSQALEENERLTVALRDYHRDAMGTNLSWFEEAKKQAAKTVAALEAVKVAEAKAALIPNRRCNHWENHEPHVAKIYLGDEKDGYFYCDGMTLTPAADASEGSDG